MELSVNCPNCNRRIAYPPASAGAVWLCPDCQRRVQLPEEVPPPPLPGEEVPSTEIMLADTPVDLPAIIEPAAVEASNAGEAPPDDAEWVEPVGNPLMPWLIVSGVLVFLLAMTILYISLRRPPAWDTLHRQDILDLKAEGERLGGLGKYRDAYNKFQDLDRLVEGNPVTNPELKSAIREAQDEEQQMLTQILDASAREAQIKARQSGLFAGTGSTTGPTTGPGVAAGSGALPAPPPRPNRPAVRAITPPMAIGTNGKPLVDDDRIGRTIRNGAQFLLGHFQNNRIKNTSSYADGDVDALVLYALLQAYQATEDSRLDPRRNFMAQALDELKRMPMNDHHGTYGRALRIMALQLAGRRGDLPAIETDLQALLRTGRNGANSYFDWEPPANDPGPQISFNWDNSNSQYGLLGAWAAAEAGVNVPRGYWLAAQHHWVSSQMQYGMWAYYASDAAGTRSMTMAGLASLIVSQDFLHDSDSDTQPAAVNAAAARADATVTSAIDKAMRWLEAGDNASVPFNDVFPGYSLYGLERVGLASGYKYFGSHDWYRESAADVVDLAGNDGGWSSREVDTSFALLILSRGRHPIMLNKLRFDGDWNARPRDAANLADYASKTLERQVNWQVVPLNHVVADWSDTPLLYLSSHDPPPMNQDDEEKIREFVLNGGLIMTQANTDPKPADQKNGDAASFDDWVTDLGTRLFPPYQWTDLPADHPLWNVLVRLKNRPKLKVIGNGSRIFMVQLPDDIARVWQSREQVDRVDDFALGLDLFLYAAGKSELRNRLESDDIPVIGLDPRASTSITQLHVGDESDPEPMAWPRFARWFRLQTDLGVLLYERALEDLKPTDSPIAHMTGVSGFKPTEAQCQALREYVQAGGIVLIDPCGGPNAFLASVKNDLLPRAFASVNLTRMSGDHPLLTNSADGMSQLEPADLRDYVRGLDPPIDRGIWMLRSGKGAVIVSSLDITTGLLGANHWGIAGFTPQYSLSLVKNLVLWAWDGGKDQ